MRFEIPTEESPMAHDLPSRGLTPDSRTRAILMKEWHRTTDHEFDLQLDILYSADSVPKEIHYNHCPNLARHFDWSMPSSGKVSEMEEHGTATDASAGAQAAQAPGAESNQAPDRETTENQSLPLPTNDFDNPEYHVQDTHPEETGSLAQAAPRPSVEMKHEVAATLGSDPVNSMFSDVFHHDGLANGHTMQRMATEPNIHMSYPQLDGGMPASNGSYYQASGVHPGLQSQFHKPSNLTTSQFGRTRGHTTGFSPVMHHIPQYKQYPVQGESNLRYQTNGVWDQNPGPYGPYGPTQTRNPVPHQSYHAVGNHEFNYNPPHHSFSGAGKEFINPNNNQYSTLSSNLPRGNINNSRLSGSHNLHHNSDAYQHLMPMDLQNHPHRLHGYPDVPAAMVLKSQSPRNPGNSANNAQSASPRARNCNKLQEFFNMVNEDDELELPDVELNYSTIEAARAAERPTIKSNANKDETIPRTDLEKQLLVTFLFRCMYTTKPGEAADNAGMINQWLKLRQDEARVEQAAWRVLVSQRTC